VLPLHVLENKGIHSLEEGSDVSENLGIVKYDPPLPAQLAGQAKGNFPSLVPKTSEERIQNLSKVWSKYSSPDLTWEITEKAEGSSCSFFLDQKGNFEVCSRNLSLKEDANNAFWKAAIAYQVKERMQELNLQGYALQGELVGEGIQGNIYGIKGVDFYLYSIWDTKEGKYICPEERILLCKELGLKHVPVLAQRASLAGNSIQAVLSFAEGKSALNPKQEREGVVFKANESQLHFKAISNKYLLKQKVD
jgi:RNA ligase (TIGR02306 family)